MQKTALRAGIVIALLGGTSCGGDRDPTSPSPITQIVVTSPVDSLLDVQAQVQLTAEATNGQGHPASTSDLAWRSSDESVAIVSTSGLVVALSPGLARISAEVDGVIGSVQLRIVEADLEGISRLLADPFLETLLQSLTTTAAKAGVDKADDALAAGNLVLLIDGLLEVRQSLATTTNANDRALAAVAVLLVDHAFTLAG